MTFTFLGTGTSQGIPIIGCNCPVCHSSNPKDRRTRTSGLFSWGDYRLLIDIGPDFRQQALGVGLHSLSAVFLTHEHADHTAGLDDIRPINFLVGPIPFYGLPRVLADLQQRFHYVFEDKQYPGLPEVTLHPVQAHQQLTIGDQSFECIPVVHGSMDILGIKTQELVYITDASLLSDAVVHSIKHCKILVLNALRKKEHHSHLSLRQALEYVDRIQPDRCYLTHISHQMGLHDEVEKELMNPVSLAYDGLTLSLSDEPATV